MAVLAGFHTEGWDYLILHSLLAKILNVDESYFQSDYIDQPGRGWEFVLDMLPIALRRFYSQCAQLVIVEIDNDGNLDLVHSGQQEDPNRPRHWNHETTEHEACRYCSLKRVVDDLRPYLTWLPLKPGGSWPVILAVPVEMIESWLLVFRGDHRAENESRQRQKIELYGHDVATRDDVERISLPMIRALSQEDLIRFARQSRSFEMFRDEVLAIQTVILGNTDCWQNEDRGAER